MSIFGKKRVKAVEAVHEFLKSIYKDVASNWQAVCDMIEEASATEPARPSLSACASNKAASFEFYLAVVAMQMRAAYNLLPQEQAARLKGHVTSWLEAVPRDKINEYLLPSELYLDESYFEVHGDDGWDGQLEALGNASQKMLKVYDSYVNSFEQLIEDYTITTHGPAFLFCRRLNLIFPPSKNYPEGCLCRPFLTKVVNDMMGIVGGTYWKEYLKRHTIVS